MIVTVDQHGNTSAASVPLALDVAVRDGRIRRGHHVLLQGVGGGFTWGSVLLQMVRTVKLAFVFPGQGSQSVGMLSSFADVRRSTAVLDRARRTRSGRTSVA